MLNYKQRPTFQYQNDTIPFLQLKSPRPCINAWDSGKFKVQSQTCLCDGDGLDHNIGEKHPISGVLSQKFGKSPAIFFNFFSLLEISDRIFFSNLFFFLSLQNEHFFPQIFYFNMHLHKKNFFSSRFFSSQRKCIRFWEKKRKKKWKLHRPLHVYHQIYLPPTFSPNSPLILIPTEINHFFRLNLARLEREREREREKEIYTEILKKLKTYHWKMHFFS